MTVYYVDPTNGNDGDNGQSWANAKLTLNGVEDIPIAASDTVYVGPGVYRELLTCDVSGTSGNEITYIADVTGENTDGVGGLVRITGSDDDQTETRTHCIDTNAQNFRTFRGFLLDMATTTSIEINGTNCIIEDCVIWGPSGTNNGILFDGASQSNGIVRRCFFHKGSGGRHVYFFHSAVVNDTTHLVENCIMIGGQHGVRSSRVGGITVKNCTIMNPGSWGVRVSTALDTGQTITVNNCIFLGCENGALEGTVSGEIVEDYNTLFDNNVDRTNVATGANSQTYPPLFEPTQLYDGIKMPQNSFLLSQWSPVRAITGTSESTDDLFGFTRPTSSSTKSWGAIQFQDYERETSRIRSGCASWVLNNAGLMQFFVPTTNVSTTFSVYVNRAANYGGATCPQMIVRQPGVSDDTTTDTGAASAWNELTTTLTPAASPSFVTVLLKSHNTTGSSGSNVGVYFDDFTVS